MTLDEMKEHLQWKINIAKQVANKVEYPDEWRRESEILANTLEWVLVLLEEIDVDDKPKRASPSKRLYRIA